MEYRFSSLPNGDPGTWYLSAIENRLGSDRVELEYELRTDECRRKGYEVNVTRISHTYAADLRSALYEVVLGYRSHNFDGTGSCSYVEGGESRSVAVAAYVVNGVLFLGDAAIAGRDGTLLNAHWFFSEDTDQNRASLTTCASNGRKANRSPKDQKKYDEAVKLGRVLYGMTKSEVTDAVGDPIRKKKDTLYKKPVQRWDYHGYSLFFDDDGYLARIEGIGY